MLIVWAREGAVPKHKRSPIGNSTALKSANTTSHRLNGISRLQGSSKRIIRLPVLAKSGKKQLSADYGSLSICVGC
jgi:hypothetical protein